MKRLVIKNKEEIKKKIQHYFERNEEAKFIHRLHGILLFSEKEDESCDSIGALFGNSPRTLSNWIKRVNETGDIESLRSKKQSGRPSRLSEEQQQELKIVLQELPEKHGISNWIHLLSEILVKTLKTLGELPERNSAHMQYVLQSCQDILLEGTERPIQRPQAEDRQKSCYSGKKNS